MRSGYGYEYGSQNRQDCILLEDHFFASTLWVVHVCMSSVSGFTFVSIFGSFTASAGPKKLSFVSFRLLSASARPERLKLKQSGYSSWSDSVMVVAMRPTQH